MDKLLKSSGGYVFLIDSSLLYKYSPNLVGFCNSKSHKGYLSITQMKAHKCLEKECSCFRRVNHQNPFWSIYDEKQEKKKDYKKDVSEKEKLKKQRKEKEKILAKETQEIFDRMQIEAEVTRVSCDKKTKIFYVSNARIPDYIYSDLLWELKGVCSSSIHLQRVKNLNGKYATIQEWHDSPGYKEKINN